MTTPPSRTPFPPNLHFVMEMIVEVGSALEMGESFGVGRRVVPITGGTFQGPSLSGIVLPGGADWQYTRPDRVSVLEARYTLQTAEGDLIGVVNRGFRHGPSDLAQQIARGLRVQPSEYYFMTSPVFDTCAPTLQWLTRVVFLGHAERQFGRVILTVWKAGDEPKLGSVGSTDS